MAGLCGGGRNSILTVVPSIPPSLRSLGYHYQSCALELSLEAPPPFCDEGGLELSVGVHLVWAEVVEDGQVRSSKVVSVVDDGVRV